MPSRAAFAITRALKKTKQRYPWAQAWVQVRGGIWCFESEQEARLYHPKPPTSFSSAQSLTSLTDGRGDRAGGSSNVIVSAIPGGRAVADDINILSDANNDTAMRTHDFPSTWKRITCAKRPARTWASESARPAFLGNHRPTDAPPSPL
jgi:hypothetical protein